MTPLAPHRLLQRRVTDRLCRPLARVLRATLLLGGFAFVVGCPTLGRHQELEDRVRDLEKFKIERDLLRKQDEQRLENLAKKIQGAATELRADFARLANKLEGSVEEQRKVLGRLEELDFLAKRLNEEMGLVKKFLEQRFRVVVEARPPDMPKDPEKILVYAQREFKAKRYEQTITALRIFLRDFPKHEKFQAGGLLLGETYRAQGRWGQALAAYEMTYTHDIKTAEAATSLWYSALALEAWGKCKKSRQMLKYLLSNHKSAAEVAQAKAKLKEKCEEK